MTGLLLLAGWPLLAQSRQITGQVLDDSLRTPLPFANISFVPVEEGATLRFAMTDQQGRFRFKASGAAGLRMTTTYLGYQSTSITLPAGTKDTTLQITLRLQPLDLAMVEVKDRAPPVVVRGDTVTYQADAFGRYSTGSCRTCCAACRVWKWMSKTACASMGKWCSR